MHLPSFLLSRVDSVSGSLHTNSDRSVPTDLSFPLHCRRSEDFFFTSTIELICNTSLLTHFQWSINNRSLSSCPNVFLLDPILLITTTTEEFHIPARTLPLSIDELKFSVSMNRSSTFTTTKSSSWRFTGVPQSLKSSLILPSDSLRADFTYQWLIHGENERSHSLQATGSPLLLLLRVEETSFQLITIG